MVTSSTRGVCGQRLISSLRMRAVVDLPTATDPATPGKRLAKLASHRVEAIANLARVNPGLPNAALREHLARGRASAWANPLVTLLLLDGAPTADLMEGARSCLVSTTPPSAEIRAAVTSVARAWWASESVPINMLGFLCHVGAHHLHGSPHRAAVLALCLAAQHGCREAASYRRFFPFEAWSRGGPRPTGGAPSLDLDSRDLDPSARSLLDILQADQTRRWAATMGELLLQRATVVDQLSGQVTRIKVPASLCDVLRAAIPDPTEGL